MAIPSQVTEASELAEQLHKQMFSGVQGVTEEEILEEDTSDSEDEIEDDTDEEDVPHDDDVEELRKFKSRYLSLKGKYDAEVPKLHQDIKEMKQNVFERLNSITEQSQPKQEQVVSNDIVSRLKDEYGDDFIDGMRALAEQIADEKMKTSLANVTDKVASVEDTQYKVAQENFKNYLDGKIEGNWRTEWDSLIQGNNPKFTKFLSKPDPSGLYTYGDLTQMYVDNWEADKLAKVFNTYLESSKPAPKQDTTPNPSREAMVAPSRNTTHNTPNTNDKRIWNKETISMFEREDRAGKYNSEESKAMWDDLLSAVTEGRIR